MTRTDDAWRALARQQWHEEGECEIDDDAQVSSDPDEEDRGAYVQAWVWVRAPEEEEA